MILFWSGTFSTFLPLRGKQTTIQNSFMNVLMISVSCHSISLTKSAQAGVSVQICPYICLTPANVHLTPFNVTFIKQLRLQLSYWKFCKISSRSGHPWFEDSKILFVATSVIVAPSMIEDSNDLIVATRCSSNAAGDRTYTYVSNFWVKNLYPVSS